MKISYKMAIMKIPLIFILCSGLLLLGCEGPGDSNTSSTTSQGSEVEKPDPSPQESSVPSELIGKWYAIDSGGDPVTIQIILEITSTTITINHVTFAINVRDGAIYGSIAGTGSAEQKLYNYEIKTIAQCEMILEATQRTGDVVVISYAQKALDRAKKGNADCIFSEFGQEMILAKELLISEQATVPQELVGIWRYTYRDEYESAGSPILVFTSNTMTVRDSYTAKTSTVEITVNNGKIYNLLGEELYSYSIKSAADYQAEGNAAYASGDEVLAYTKWQARDRAREKGGVGAGTFINPAGIEKILLKD
jgi:hypothetical protein